MRAEFEPQFMRRAAMAAHAAGGAGLAAGRLQGFLDGIGDVGDGDVLGRAGEAIAAAGAARGGDQPGAAERGEELFEIGEGEGLGLGDLAEGDAGGRLALAGAAGKLDHGHDGVATAGGETHGLLPQEIHQYLPIRTGARERFAVWPVSLTKLREAGL